MEASGFDSKVTIDQVAAICGVSKTTISRFLNGKYANMSQETQDRIRRAVQELNYRPNRSAQRLKARNSMLVGCVISDIGTPFSGLLLRGVTRVCEEAGYQVLFAESGGSPERERRIIEGFLENRIDGLILNITGDDEEYVRSLLSRGVPTVLADRELSTPDLVDTVTSPSRDAARQATEFLFRQGYTAVAFFSEKMGNISPRFLRRQGYTDAVTACSSQQPEIYEFEPDQLEDCAAGLNRFLQSHVSEFPAILSSNGTGALTLLRAVDVLGLEIGSELGLCTFDDWDWLRIAKPSVTAVALGTEEIGARSARLLLDRISGTVDSDTPARYVQVPARLEIRPSTPSVGCRVV